MNKKFKLLTTAVISIIVLAVVFCLGVYAIFSTGFWQKLPEGLKAQVAFTKLEALSHDSVCRESCMLEKRLYAKLIADYLVKEPKIMENQIKRYLNMDDSKVVLQMKADLVSIAKMAEELKQGNDSTYQIVLPVYLADFLSDPNTNQDIKRQILASFDQQIGASAWVVDELFLTVEDEGRSLDERIPALWDLSNIAAEAKEDGSPRYEGIDYPALCDLLVDLAISKENDNKLRKAALEKMYACTNFSGNYTSDIFAKIRTVFEDRSEHLGIRDEALTEIKTYAVVSSSTTREYMDKVYNDKNEHEYLRFNAWMFFRDRSIGGYEEPYINGDVFDGYINESSQVQYVRKSYSE